MTKRASTKYKIDRRLGVNLWGRPKSPHNARTYRPGQHGQTLAHKPTEYGTQLMAKQKLKGYYGNVSERQFLRYYKEAVRRRGDTSEELIALLESRLDCIIYRLKFAPTVFAARQLVNHGHILVNGKRVNIPSYITQVNDVIEVHPNSRSMTLVMNAIALAERDVPDYFSVDANGFKGTFTRVPKFAEVPYPTQMSPHLIVEFYSR